MGTLHLALQVGFREDSVEVRVNGESVYAESDVTTSLLLGVADSIEYEIRDGSHEVVVELPDRQLTSEYEVKVTRDAYLGVSVERSQVVFRESDEPFGYL
ncbi:hypothetical protein [Halorussus pelagicus]|uniref:hypothetical protein n=1 Tax=Halorussus pelagicus TaxID=2505977 RepID=UPI000FFB87E1|nr:hypothetical protein [Halorussus pelagicus]